LPRDGRSSQRPNIREQSYPSAKDGMFANEEESIYGHSTMRTAINSKQHYVVQLL
jgi:hypothetical protein